MDEETFGGYDFTSDDDVEVATMSAERPTSSEISQWASWIKPFPLPQHCTPSSEIDWTDVSDETLMAAPPQLIVHLQRTAAQQGLQVISPRQTPFSCLMGRTRDSRRGIADHVVGSVASLDTVWPTLDGADMSNWLPDEPLPDIVTGRSMREKTKALPLTSAGRMMRDPILACLIKGRAVIDIVRREDVAGDADGLVTLLCEAWGVPEADFNEMDAFTLGIEGPLLRHAIRADEVYPTMHAPIHHKLCVSVSNTEVNREMLPGDTAMDWRRMRVFCEAVFTMNCAIEGVSLSKIRCVPPPGDPTAPLSRSNILAFRPLPCTAWTFEPRGFSVCPVFERGVRNPREIPPDVLVALSRYVEHVRPVSFAMEAGHRAVAVRTQAVRAVPLEGETLSDAYAEVVGRMVTGGARGKTAAATVRNVIFETVENCKITQRLRIARYLKIVKEEVSVHLQTSVVPDAICDRLALKFVEIGDTIRMKIAAEATRRGYTVTQWWHDITAQAPLRYQMMTEGTHGWASVAMWLIFRAPTENWERLVNAVHYGALREVARLEVGGIPLPPVKGSKERVLEAARAVVIRTTRAYAGYYMAVSDVGHAVSDEMAEMGRSRGADTLKEAAHLWALRARALRGTNVQIISKDTPTPSQNHMRVPGESFDLLIVPCPYRAFEAYKAHVRESKIVNNMAKRALAEYSGTRISDIFPELQAPLAPAKASTVTRYLLQPRLMANAMEQSWSELTEDVYEVVKTYALETTPRPLTSDDREVPLDCSIDMGRPKKTRRLEGKSYWDLIAVMDPDMSEWYEDTLENVEAQLGIDLQERRYADEAEMRAIFLAAAEGISTSGMNTQETVM